MTTTIDYHDVNGAPCAPAQAHTAEITEHDADGEVLQRTYGYVRGSVPPEAGEEPWLDDEVADEPKATWDVYAMDAAGVLHLVDKLADLEPIIGSVGQEPTARREIIGNLLTLPSWDAMPKGLRQEISAYLEATRVPTP